MKKILSICFGLLVCLVLTACGGSEGETLASDIIVHVEVNPSFDIHVNNDGTIKSVDCLNEDAQNVYAEMDLTGTAYEDGFKQLLTAIHDAGFMSEDAKITVDIKQKSSVTYDVSKVTDEVIADFDANVAAVESDVSSEVAEEQQAEKLGIWTLEIYTYPASATYVSHEHQVKIGLLNNRIVSVTCEEDFMDDIDIKGVDLYEGLSKILNAMHENGYLGSDRSLNIYGRLSNEALQIELYQFVATYQKENDLDVANTYVGDLAKAGGNYEIVSNGEIVKVGKLEGAWYERRETYQNSVLRTVIIESEDGIRRYQEEQYNTNGVITSAIVEMADGTSHEQRYDVNGEMTYNIATSEDGQTVEELFLENGVPIKKILRGVDYIFTHLYDENGNITESTEEYSDGSKNIYYYENGNQVGHTRYDANGNVISE